MGMGVLDILIVLPSVAVSLHAPTASFRRIPTPTFAPRVDSLVAVQLPADQHRLLDALQTMPQWESGAKVSVQQLYEQACLAVDPMSDDAFDNAIEYLEASGALRIEEGLTDDDDDWIFNAKVDGDKVEREAAPSAVDLEEAESGVQNEVPMGVVVFDRERHALYDYEAEQSAAEAVVCILAKLKRFGVESADTKEWPALTAACNRLAEVTADSPAPPLRDDPRLFGDWELVGTTSKEFSERRGVSGLGNAPFTAPKAVFFRFLPTGVCLAKEVLEFFGNPVVLNELRGRFGFSADGIFMQEQYTEADMGGQLTNPSFSGGSATLRGLCITADGSMRIGSGGTGGAFFVFKKILPGELDAWLQSWNLPLCGGTAVVMSKEQQRVAYPYRELI
uniref:Plastid lipid-associated protein/fibrillin conserved domain-containing protein n=1 Tax=Coccolithus braarudii TaxID=221442 RepID=A0A7S0Q5G0_9EUKA|mmetsp:Transcript_442/g.884  ORF Transcript_442/g.884 Transcript_442/m.884 type:complete len:392 (+) Transcript_442:7-1182(+)